MLTEDMCERKDKRKCYSCQVQAERDVHTETFLVFEILPSISVCLDQPWNRCAGQLTPLCRTHSKSKEIIWEKMGSY